ncbi:MAG: MFS transporter [Planctomycetales bacterium]|nr:MFS transporter [Planctomycetales bacterium]
MNTSTALSSTQRLLVLAAGFLGWMFAGVQLGATSIVMRDAAKDLLGATDEGEIGHWFGWLVSVFMLGAACGGYLFGWIGDHKGRRNGMAYAIACYSLAAGITSLVTSPNQLLVARFLVGLGVGGMWPNGIALVAEAWPNMSRPLLAGVIGTAANIGILLFSILTAFVDVTPDDWRWTMHWTTAPIILAAMVFAFVPESPRWLAAKAAPRAVNPDFGEVFRPPLLRVTLIGIALGTVPLFGGWGNANWANAWAAQVGDAIPASDRETNGDASEKPTPTAEANPKLKAYAMIWRSLPGSVASLLGGAIATIVGRRRFYFCLSVICLICAQCLFRFSYPGESSFLIWMGVLGGFSGFFFGWLPLYLPELFPTRVRSTGAGVSFNFGRIGTAVGILIAAELLKQVFAGDYAAIGRLTSWIYAFGAIIILVAPNTAGKELED